METTKRFLKSAEVAEILRISERTLQNYRSEGKILFYKISKKNILYRVEDVEELLKNSSCVSYQKDRLKVLLDKYVIRSNSQMNQIK